MTPSASRHGAAVSTYLMRPGFRLWSAFLLIDALMLIAAGMTLHLTRGNIQPQSTFATVFELFFVTAMIGPYVLFIVFMALTMQHLREQLADPRVKLIPGFAIPHLRVGFAVMVLIPIAEMFALLTGAELIEPRLLPFS